MNRTSCTPTASGHVVWHERAFGGLTKARPNLVQAITVKFSVVIPLYNKAPYIVAAIESVLAQTFENFEVIVVDDGSTDGSAALVHSIVDARVRLVKQANAGVSAARNHGINIARGEWVAFLDADDWHHPRYLESLVEAQNVCPEAHTVAADFITAQHAEGTWPPTWPTIDDRDLGIEIIDDLPLRWTSGPCMFTSGIAVQRQQLLEMQPCFPVGESRGEDLDLWFRLAERFIIVLVHRPLAAYRVGIVGSLTEDRQAVEMEPFMQRMRERALAGALTAKQRSSSLQLIAHFEISMARQAIVSGNRLEALRWLVAARYAISRKRWWLTMFMTVAIPSQFVRRWEAWRIDRMEKILEPAASVSAGGATKV